VISVMKRIRFCFGAAIFVGALVGALRQELMHEIAVRAVQFEHVETSFMGAPRGVAPGCTRSLTSPRSSAFGTGHRSLWAIALGATGDQASNRRCLTSAGAAGRLPTAASRRALRPEWPSWMPATEFCCLMNLTRRESGSTKASSQMPRSPTVPQPRRSTWSIPPPRGRRPPAANLPAFIKCQSVGKPLIAEYWCIGGTTMRVAQFDAADRRRRKQQCLGHVGASSRMDRIARRTAGGVSSVIVLRRAAVLAASVLAFGLAGAVFAAFGWESLLRAIPQGSVLCCAGILPSER